MWSCVSPTQHQVWQAHHRTGHVEEFGIVVDVACQVRVAVLRRGLGAPQPDARLGRLRADRVPTVSGREGQPRFVRESHRVDAARQRRSGAAIRACNGFRCRTRSRDPVRRLRRGDHRTSRCVVVGRDLLDQGRHHRSVGPVLSDHDVGAAVRTPRPTLSVVRLSR